MKKFFAPFKELPTGIYRLIIVSSILISLIIGIIMQLNASYSSDGEEFWEGLIVGFITYWILARMGIWVYAGFKADKSKFKG